MAAVNEIEMDELVRMYVRRNGKPHGTATHLLLRRKEFCTMTGARLENGMS